MSLAVGLTPEAAWAQQCRRSCKAGEDRDARGCCIPKKLKPEQKEEDKAKQESRARNERERTEGERREKERTEKAAREERRKEQAKEATSEDRAAKKSRRKEPSEGRGRVRSVTRKEDAAEVLPRESEIQDGAKGGQDERPRQGTRPATTNPAAIEAREPRPVSEIERVDRETVRSPSSAEMDGSVSVRATGEDARQQSWPTWMPWTVVGAGAALTVTGGMLEWRAVTNGDSFDREFIAVCEPSGCIDSEFPELHDRLEKAELQQRLAMITFIAGGAAIATGLVLAYLNQPAGTTGDVSSNISLEPMLSRDATGMAVNIQF